MADESEPKGPDRKLRSEGERRARALGLSENEEATLFAEALKIFAKSPDLRHVEPRQREESLALVGQRKERALAYVESDRAAYRKSAIQAFEARWMLGRAIERAVVVTLLGVIVLVLLAIVSRFTYGWAATPVDLISVAALGVLGPALIDRVGELPRSYRARQRANLDLAAARTLLMQALVEDALPGLLHELRLGRAAAQPAPDDHMPPAAPAPDAGTGQARARPSETERQGARVAAPSRIQVAPIDPENLVELYRSSQQIPTKGRQRLRTLVAALSGASIGIAGARGIGKTTLLRWFFDHQAAEGHLGVQIAAPVRYEARDFVLAVFAQMCRALMGPRDLPLLTERESFLSSTRAAWLGGVLLVAGVVAYFTTFTISGSTHHLSGVGLGACGVLLLLLRISRRSRGAVAGPSYLSDETIRASDNPDEIAPQLLREIRFQLTFSAGYSGKLTTGLGEVGAEASYSLAARQESFPDVVSRFQAFLQAVARQRKRVYIGIDELDKLPAEDAVCFLDDIKGLFGVPNCFFLVCISEDALAQFERRGMPMRDAFDSAFDEVLRIEPLTAKETRGLLATRASMDAGLSSLCHVLGSGIPREVIRQARRLALMTRNRPYLEDVVTDLIRGDLRERVSGLTPTSSSSFENWHRLIVANPDSPSAYVASLKEVRQDSRAPDSVRALAYLAETVLELVSQDQTGELSALAAEADALAHAREHSAGFPAASRHQCKEIRIRTGLDRARESKGNGLPGRNWLPRRLNSR